VPRLLPCKGSHVPGCATTVHFPAWLTLHNGLGETTRNQAQVVRPIGRAGSLSDEEGQHLAQSMLPTFDPGGYSRGFGACEDDGGN
jgi:hypothetical protein